MRPASALLVAALLAPAARADDPSFVMTHTGRLLDGADQPVDNPELKLSFRVFALSAATQGEKSLWESGDCTVAVVHGFYAVSLGGDCGTNLNASVLPPEQPRYLEVQVGTTRLAPRLRIGSTATAAFATFAGTAGIAQDSQKLGGVLPGGFWQKSDQVEAATLGGKSFGDLTAGYDLRYVQLGGLATQQGGFSIDGIGKAAAFEGDGSGLTGLDGSKIATGLIARERLPADLATVSGANRFTGDQTFSGAVTAARFAGDGSALTALDAGKLTNTVPTARLPSDVAYTSTSQTFAGDQTIGGLLAVNGSSSGSMQLSLPGTPANGKPSATLGFAGFGAQHGEISFVPGQGFFLLDTSSGSPAAPLDPATATKVDLTARNVTGAFTGSGANLTSLNASALASGTVPDARLSSNVATLSASSLQTFSGALSASALTARGDLTVNGRVVAKGANTPVGSIDVPVLAASATAAKTSWAQLGPSGIALDTSAYAEFVGPGQALYARLCAAWTDSGDNSDSWNLRIRSDASATVVAYSMSMGNTWSGSGLYHTGCGGWVPASQFATCGTGWGGTCLMEASAASTSTHASFPVTFQRGHLELAVK